MNPDLALMPFQEDGSNLLAKLPRAMLVWDAGVGKTPTAVRACVKADARRILVFCPPIGVSVWRDHFSAWSHYKPYVMDSAHALKPYAFMTGAGVRIIPYSRCRPDSAVMRAACDHDWDAVIIDECHYLKSSDAQRTRAIYGAKTDLVKTPLERAKHIWCLSGTPVLNHPAEFWTHLRALAPEVLVLPQLGKGPMDEGVFIDRFCVTRATPYGVQIRGGKNAPELVERIRPLIDRKRIKDVLTDLPALRIVEHPLPADTAIDRTLRTEMDDALRDLGFDPEALDDDALLAAIQSGQIGFSTIRRLIGRAKVEGVTTMVKDFLNDNEEAKLIVFAHHREVIRDLADNLKADSPLVITGATTLAARDNAITGFQTDPRLRLIILAIEAAGEVITLHAAHNVWIAEPSPVPAKNAQAIARAHRKGQKHPVLARFILLPGTLDARLMEIVARKTRDIARLVDNESAPEANVGLAFPDAI
jgi:SWI/SNF-related matrix-associated actin-dependent regulator 1 of chromatin subfamily A